MVCFFIYLFIIFIWRQTTSINYIKLREQVSYIILYQDFAQDIEKEKEETDTAGKKGHSLRFMPF